MSTQTQGSGIGFTGLLTIVFIVLKLTHVVGWSWWWVLAPAWVPLAFVLAIFCVAGIILGIVKMLA